MLFRSCGTPRGGFGGCRLVGRENGGKIGEEGIRHRAITVIGLAVMRRVLRFLRVVIPRISVGLLLAQLAFMIGVTGWESLRKKHRKLRRFPYSPAKPVAVGQDEVTVYTFGEELYRDMLAAIDGARKVVNFETYIWKSDEVGEAFKEALGRAAARTTDRKSVV